MTAIRGLLLGGLAAITLPAAAVAADIPARAPVYAKAPPPVVSLWEGPYIGIHGGYGWSASTVTDNNFGLGAVNADGNNAFGGFQIGYNHHLSANWILGYEVDASFGRLRGNGALGPFPTSFDIDVFGTARTRLGYANGPFLTYITGGVAWAVGSFNAPAVPYSFERAHVGYTIGAGVEYAFSRNLSAKVEYLFADFDGTTGPITSTDLSMHMVRVGLNYRFGDIVYAVPAAAYPTKAPVAQAFTWSGAYIGVHGGYSWSNYEIAASGLGSANADLSGGFGGFQTGYNWQISPNIVIGIEGDSSWGGISTVFAGAPIEIDAMGTVRGRLGYAMDRVLVYATGGLSWAHVNMIAVSDGYLLGWNVGAGVEYAISPRWSAKVEYLYSDLGPNNENVLGVSIDERISSHTLKVGLNYRASLLGLLFQR